MSRDFDLKDYVTVAERMVAWYAAHPEGRIVCDVPAIQTIGNRSYIEVTARVYRSAEDVLPCQASAWEPHPGSTPFTRDSEMMNAETAAIGRALAAAGIEVKRGMASREDVRNRAASPPADAPDREAGGPSGGAPSSAGAPSQAKLSQLIALFRSKGVVGPRRYELASELLGLKAPIASSSELDADQMDVLVELLTDWQPPEPVEQPPLPTHEYDEPEPRKDTDA